VSDEDRSGTLDPERYDRWFERPWGRHAFSVERDALLAALGPLDGEELLDRGCGTGRFTAAFEHAGAEVTGIDNDPAMLARAAARTDAARLLADAHSLPVSDDTFDVAVAVTLLEFAATPNGSWTNCPGSRGRADGSPSPPQPRQPVGPRSPARTSQPALERCPSLHAPAAP
jgi:SAM-dependent methyltransferase